MARIDIRTTKLEDALTFLPLLRDSDREELRHSGKSDLLTILTTAIRQSDMCLTVLFDGKPAAICGCHCEGIVLGYGMPWNVNTAEVDRRPRLFLRAARIISDIMLYRYGRLENWMLAHNMRARQALIHLGYTFDKFPVMMDGVMNVRYWKEKP